MSMKPVAQIHRENAAKAAAKNKGGKKPAAKAPAKAATKPAAKAAPAKPAAAKGATQPEYRREIVTLDQLIRDAELQQRVGGTDDAVTTDYKNDLLNGAEFPDVIAFQTPDKELLLADGFKRVAAHEQAGMTEIAVRIYKGTRDDAIWYSCSANKTHGQRRTNEDKRKAVQSALMIESKRNMSDRAIAEHCGTSPAMVGSIRQKMVADGHIPATTERTSADGKKVVVDQAASEKRATAGKASAVARTPDVEVQTQDEVDPEQGTDESIVDDAELLSDTDVQAEVGDDTVAAAPQPRPAKPTAPVNDGVLLDANDAEVPEELHPVFKEIDGMHKMIEILHRLSARYTEMAAGPAGKFLDPSNAELLSAIAEQLQAGTPYTVDAAYADGWAPTKPDEVEFNKELVPASE